MRQFIGFTARVTWIAMMITVFSAIDKLIKRRQPARMIRVEPVIGNKHEGIN